MWSMKSLTHNGVYIIPRYQGQSLHILIDDVQHKLTSEQEEMAVAWVKKLDTDYVKDPVFVRNFFKDFSKKLGYEKTLLPEMVNFSEVINYVKRER